MTIEAFAFRKELKLEEISDFVKRYEGGTGTLASIGCIDNYTVAVCQSGRAPDELVKLQKVADDAEQPPDGYKLVCRGFCWVENDKTKVIAIRKKKP
jgi:hypothetical protein